MIIDSHQHFWDLDRVEYPWLVPEYGPIYRSFHPDELEPQIRAAGVDRTVLVQSANSFADTDAMLAQAAAHDWIGAVVGWVPLEDAPAAAAALDERYARQPRLRGVRHLNHNEADPDWLVRPDVIAGLRVLAARGLVFEVVAVYPLHLGHVPTLARACPDLRIVIDHLAKPPIASGDLTAWKRDLECCRCVPQCRGQGIGPQHRRRSGDVVSGGPGRGHRSCDRCLWRRSAHVRQRLARRHPRGRLSARLG